MFLSIISFLVVFTIIAFVHEFGHLILAKRAGIRVYELGLGFGPKIFSYKRNETNYSINLIPILGYVRIAGEGENEEDKSCPEEEKFYSKPPIEKIKALAGGGIMNIILALILVFILFLSIGIPKDLSHEIGFIPKNSPAHKAGLKVGDKIISIDKLSFEKMEDAVKYIHNSQGKPLELVIERRGERLTIKAVPQYNSRLKVYLLGFSPRPKYQKVNPFLAAYYALQQTISMIIVTLIIIGQLLIGRVSLTELAGPVGIAQMTGQYAEQGLVSLIYFTSLISVNIGLLNLLPIPALDGGHIIFALLEIIRKKKIDPKLENKINFWGLIFLLLLIGIVSINDILRLLSNR